jgi:hypothetical protein
MEGVLCGINKYCSCLSVIKQNILEENTQHCKKIKGIAALSKNEKLFCLSECLVQSLHCSKKEYLVSFEQLQYASFV